MFSSKTLVKVGLYVQMMLSIALKMMSRKGDLVLFMINKHMKKFELFLLFSANVHPFRSKID